MKIKNALPIPEHFLGMLIKWNLQTGEYELVAEGPPVHYSNIETLLKKILDKIKSSADDAGIVGKAKKTEEDCEIPPWFKN